MEHDLIVEQDGTIKVIYSDQLADLIDEGTSVTQRASNVEPHPSGVGWYVDMRPFTGKDGPILGQIYPFKLRSEALAAEVEKLKEIMAAGRGRDQNPEIYFCP